MPRSPPTSWRCATRSSRCSTRVGGKGAAVLDVFKGEIAKAHQHARPYIKEALEANDAEFASQPWATVRAKIAAQHEQFTKPLLSKRKFGEAAQTAAAGMLPAGHVFNSQVEEANFYPRWLVQHVHDGSESVFVAAREALVRILFEGGKVKDSAELAAAVAESREAAERGQ